MDRVDAELIESLHAGDERALGVLCIKKCRAICPPAEVTKNVPACEVLFV